MANIYLRSGAAGAATGADWANAYLTETAALAGTTSADTLWEADDHSESTAGAVTLTMPTAIGAKVICANTHATEPPTGVAATAIVAVTGNNGLILQGSGYKYGIQYQGSTANNAAADITIGDAPTAAFALVMEQCGFIIRSVHAGALIQWGGPTVATTVIPMRNQLLACIAKFGATTQSIILRSGDWIVRGLTLDAAGSAPTTLFKGSAVAPGNWLLHGCDFTGVTPTNLIDQSNAVPLVVDFINCKLPAGLAIVTGTHGGPNGLIARGHNCDSADSHNRFFEYRYQGSVVQQTTTRIRSGTQQADGVAHSWLMTGNGNATIAFPLASPQLSVFNTAVGSSVTATVEILRDNVTALTDAQIWLEVDYLGSSGFPLGSFISDRVSPIFGTPANQTSSAASWDTTGMSNANTQKLSVTFTPQEAGYIRCRVMLVANTSVYVDPRVAIA